MKVLDRAAALARLDGDEELYSEIVGVFIEDTPIQMEKLVEALRVGDRPVVERQAHSIKSASGNIGGERMRDCALQIERSARTASVEDLERAVGALQNELRDLLDQLAAKS